MMVVSKKQLFNALEDEGEWWSRLNPFSLFSGEFEQPKRVIIIEKRCAFELLTRELINSNVFDTALVCSMGFASDLTVKGILRIKRSRTKVYYLGDLDPISLGSYYCIKKNSYSFMKKKDYLKVNYVGMRVDDINDYEIPENHLIKFHQIKYKDRTEVSSEKIIIDYLTQQKLLLGLSKEIKFLNKGLKAEIEVLIHALKDKQKGLLDYLKDKKVF